MTVTVCYSKARIFISARFGSLLRKRIDGLRFEAVSQLCEEWAVFGI
jgi:hypothetical protein